MLSLIFLTIELVFLFLFMFSPIFAKFDTKIKCFDKLCLILQLPMQNLRFRCFIVSNRSLHGSGGSEENVYFPNPRENIWKTLGDGFLIKGYFIIAIITST